MSEVGSNATGFMNGKALLNFAKSGWAKAGTNRYRTIRHRMADEVDEAVDNAKLIKVLFEALADAPIEFITVYACLLMGFQQTEMALREIGPSEAETNAWLADPEVPQEEKDDYLAEPLDFSYTLTRQGVEYRLKRGITKMRQYFAGDPELMKLWPEQQSKLER